MFNFFLNLTDYSTQPFCLVEFPFKSFDKRVNKRDFLKIINLYSLKTAGMAVVAQNRFRTNREAAKRQDSFHYEGKRPRGNTAGNFNGKGQLIPEHFVSCRKIECIKGGVISEHIFILVPFSQ